MPLFRRLRQALGEHRPLIETSGHVALPHEADDAVSILVMSLQFIWDCYMLSASGRDAIFISHDEHGWFASRSQPIVQAVRRRLELDADR
jgi:hypothetical protein